MSAVDAPRSDAGMIREAPLLRTIESALKVTWATLLQKLPAEEAEARLSRDTAAAEQFRQTISEAWLCLCTMERIIRKCPGGAQDEIVCKTSLAGKVLSAIANDCDPGRTSWLRVQGSFAAWWRPLRVKHAHNLPALLAVKFELFKQLRVSVPGVISAKAFRQAGINYGVFFDEPPILSDRSLAVSDGSSGVRDGCKVTDRLTGGGRLCILSPDITLQILEEAPQDDTKAANQGPSDASSKLDPSLKEDLQ
jgi:hypothetical protein